jgi:hypothetical protein
MSEEKDWSESYYFNFYDERKDLTAFMRIGSKPNRDEKEMFLFLMGKDFKIGMRAKIPCGTDRCEAAGLRFSEEKGGWRLTYRGKLYDASGASQEASQAEMDILWTAKNPLMDYHQCVDGRGAALSAKVSSEHFEQFGRAVGSISIDGINMSINGSGERDRSEGVRDWGSPQMWMWLNSVYGDDGFNATKLVTGRGDVDAGYFCTGGKNDPVIKADIVPDLSTGVPKGYSMELTGKSGRTYSVKAEVMHFIILPMNGSKDMLLIESISRTVWEGKTGFGVAEFLVPSPRVA